MREKTDFPPNYHDILLSIPEVANGKPIFCYGDTIFNPHKVELTPDLLVHEEVHMKQQGGAPEIWWEKYLNDTQFRLRQEVEAYGTQYAFLKRHTGGALLEWSLDSIAKALSGKLYGDLITHNEARCKVRNYAKEERS
jgi:hypothetical protein